MADNDKQNEDKAGENGQTEPTPEAKIKAYKETLNKAHFFPNSWGGNRKEFGQRYGKLPSGKESLAIDADLSTKDFHYANDLYIYQLLLDPHKQLTRKLKNKLGDNFTNAVKAIEGITDFDFTNESDRHHASYWSADKSNGIKNILSVLSKELSADRDFDSDTKNLITDLSKRLTEILEINDQIIPERQPLFIQDNPHAADELPKHLRNLSNAGYLQSPESYASAQNALNDAYTVAFDVLTTARDEITYAALSPEQILKILQNRRTDDNISRTAAQKDRQQGADKALETLKATLQNDQASEEDIRHATEDAMQHALFAGDVTPNEYAIGHARFNIVESLDALPNLSGQERKMATLKILRAVKDAAIRNGSPDPDFTKKFTPKKALTFSALSQALLAAEQIPPGQRAQALKNPLPPEAAAPSDTDANAVTDTPSDNPTGPAATPPSALLPQVVGSPPASFPLTRTADGLEASTQGLQPPDPPDIKPTLSDEELKRIQKLTEHYEKEVRERIATIQTIKNTGVTATIKKDGAYLYTPEAAYNNILGQRLDGQLLSTNPHGLRYALDIIHEEKRQNGDIPYTVSTTSSTLNQETGQVETASTLFIVKDDGTITDTLGEEKGNLFHTAFRETHPVAAALMDEAFKAELKAAKTTFNAQRKDDLTKYQTTTIKNALQPNPYIIGPHRPRDPLIQQNMEDDIAIELALLGQDGYANDDTDAHEKFARNMRTIAGRANNDSDFNLFITLLYNQQMAINGLDNNTNFALFAQDHTYAAKLHELGSYRDILSYSANGITPDYKTDIPPKPANDRAYDARLFPASFYAAREKANGYTPESIDVSQDPEWQAILKGTDLENSSFVSKEELERLALHKLEQLCLKNNIHPQDLTKAMLGGNPRDGIPPVCPYSVDIMIVKEGLPGNNPVAKNQSWIAKFGPMNFEGTVVTYRNGEPLEQSWKDLATARFLRIQTGIGERAEIFKELTEAGGMTRAEQAKLTHDDVINIINQMEPGRQATALKIFEEDLAATKDDRSIVDHIDLGSIHGQTAFNFAWDYEENRAAYVNTKKAERSDLYASPAQSNAQDQRIGFQENKEKITKPLGHIPDPSTLLTQTMPGPSMNTGLRDS